MKHLLLKSIACAAVLLPLGTLQAKTFGDFAPGKTFTYKVKQKITAKSVGTKITKGVPVPAGVPSFVPGQRIKFTIGAQGQLNMVKLDAKGKPVGASYSIPFKSDGGTSNVYNKVITGRSNKADTGTVFKDSVNEPTGVALNFVRTTYAGFNSTVTTVTYTLNK